MFFDEEKIMRGIMRRKINRYIPSGRLLKNLRDSTSQKQFAAGIGVSVSSLRKLETGKSTKGAFAPGYAFMHCENPEKHSLFWTW